MAEVVKITFGDNLPGYEVGDKSLPAVIVLQVRGAGVRVERWSRAAPSKHGMQRQQRHSAGEPLAAYGTVSTSQL